MGEIIAEIPIPSGVDKKMGTKIITTRNNSVTVEYNITVHQICIFYYKYVTLNYANIFTNITRGCRRFYRFVYAAFAEK